MYHRSYSFNFSLSLLIILCQSVLLVLEVLAYPGCPGKRSLNECRCFCKDYQYHNYNSTSRYNAVFTREKKLLIMQETGCHGVESEKVTVEETTAYVMLPVASLLHYADTLTTATRYWQGKADAQYGNGKADTQLYGKDDTQYTVANTKLAYIGVYAKSTAYTTN